MAAAFLSLSFFLCLCSSRKMATLAQVAHQTRTCVLSLFLSLTHTHINIIIIITCKFPLILSSFFFYPYADSAKQYACCNIDNIKYFFKSIKTHELIAEVCNFSHLERINKWLLAHKTYRKLYYSMPY